VGGHEVKLVDTSSWVEYLRQLESPASQRVESLVLDGEAAWCDMTAVELWNGTRGAREKRELAELEKEIILLPVNAGVWQVARKLALRCREAGFTLPTSDIVIAACAAHHKAELEHCDRHFDKILPLAAKL
jgi:predicted nucleic acid-binding protein